MRRLPCSFPLKFVVLASAVIIAVILLQTRSVLGPKPREITEPNR